jgi:hypothetical protein
MKMNKVIELKASGTTLVMLPDRERWLHLVNLLQYSVIHFAIQMGQEI